MPQAKLNVRLLEMTRDAVEIMYAACRQCYSAKFAGDIFDEAKEKQKGQEEFIKRVVQSGHESPMEHVKFTFAIEGVSRALTHQLVRHRVASYSQQSQRYVKEADFAYVVPPSIEKNSEAGKEFAGAMEKVQEGYNRIIDIFKKNGVEGEKANQDARYVLPQAAETKIVVTMNCRELAHFFKQRCCTRAQWEIRELAGGMLDICKEKLPSVFLDSGAKCVGLGYCPEGEKFTCGKYPLKEKMIKK